MQGGPADYVRQKLEAKSGLVGKGPYEPITQQDVNTYMEIYLNLEPQRALWQEYLNYVVNIFTLDLGSSIFVDPGVPVAQLLAEAAPWTIFLSSIAIFYSFMVGVVLGAVMAYFEGTKFDVGMTVSMILNAAIPYYVVAIVLLYFMGYQWNWFPIGGRMDPNTTPGYNWPFIQGVLYYAALPVASMIATGFGGGALGMRANSIRILGSDYIHYAHERGISSYTIATRYIARNAVLPQYTSLMISMATLIGGSVILEQIFSYPGMGMLMYQATLARDYPIITGVLFVSTAIFVAALFVADFTYSLIDPRAEQAGGPTGE
jgi:peptide/nickel transport system permease protein